MKDKTNKAYTPPTIPTPDQLKATTPTAEAPVVETAPVVEPTIEKTYSTAEKINSVVQKK